MHNVSVLDDVVLALDGEFAGFADSGLRAILDIVIVLDDLGTNEALLEVGMDDTSALGSLPTLLVGPGLDLHLTSRDECLEVQQGVGFLDETVHCRHKAQAST